MKDVKRDKESVSTGGFLPHKEPLCFIEVPSVFTKSRRTRMDLGAKELGKAYDQPEQVITRMKNHTTRTSVLPFLTYIPAKISWAVLRAYDAVHTSTNAVPADQRIGSLGTSLENFKGESLTIK